MPLIPANLRAPLEPIASTSGTTLRALLALAPGAVTIGIGNGRPTVSSVSATGLTVPARPNASSAVAVTRITQRDGRIFGVLASGQGPVISPTSAPLTAGQWYPLSTYPNATAYVNGTPSNLATITLEIQTPTGIVPFTYRASGAGDDTEITIAGGQVIAREGYPGPVREVWRQPLPINATAFRYSATGGVASPVLLGTTGGADWRSAASALSWATVGLPWWGQIESAARSGQWVRRASWTDATRQLRFVHGAGTTNAVAITQAGVRVTPTDFGSAEFLATDWQTVLATEPPPIDVTDLIFTGSTGATFFAVVGPTPDPTDPPNPSDPPTTPPLPTTGQGFLYLRDGVATLVPARDITGADWEP